MNKEQAVIQKYLNNIDMHLLTLLSDRAVTPKEAEALTEGFRIDDENFYVSSILAKIGMRDGFAGFRADLVPRLKGLHSFHLVRRALNFAEYGKLIDALQQEKLEFAAGYNLSLDAKYITNDFQTKNLFDIVVRTKDQKEAKRILNGEWKTFQTRVIVSDDPLIWETAEDAVFEGRKLKVLSREAMLLLSFEWLHRSVFSRKLNTFESVTDRMRWLYELRALDTGEGLDLAKLSAESKKRGRVCYDDIRILLAYAYTAYGNEKRLDGLNEALPQRPGKLYLLY